jgi:hypothetical protein
MGVHWQYNGLVHGLYNGWWRGVSCYDSHGAAGL